MEFRWWVAGRRQFCCSESEDEAGTNVTFSWHQMGFLDSDRFLSNVRPSFSFFLLLVKGQLLMIYIEHHLL